MFKFFNRFDVEAVVSIVWGMMPCLKRCFDCSEGQRAASFHNHYNINPCCSQYLGICHGYCDDWFARRSHRNTDQYRARWHEDVDPDTDLDTSNRNLYRKKDTAWDQGQALPYG